MLNTSKCIFGADTGKILSFLVSQRGIKVKPHMIDAIKKMRSPTLLWGVQKLTGCMVALSWLISRLGDRGLSFVKLLR